MGINLNKSEIFRGRQTTHPVIFIEPKNEKEFFGIILTHSHINKYGGNIQLKHEHFEAHNETGEKYRLQYDSTLIPVKQLINNNDWGPFVKVGNLTLIGNEFIEEHIDDLEPLGWGELSGREKP